MKNSQNQYIKLTFQNSLINDFLRVNALLSLLYIPNDFRSDVPSRQPPWKQLSSSIAGECCQVVEMSSMLLSTMSLFSQAKHFSVSASLLIRLHLKEKRKQNSSVIRLCQTPSYYRICSECVRTEMRVRFILELSIISSQCRSYAESCVCITMEILEINFTTDNSHIFPRLLRNFYIICYQIKQILQILDIYTG